MKILTFMDYYLPGFRAGGPVRTISGTVSNLPQGFDFQIVTRDRDFGDSHAYPNARPNEWVQVGRARVLYIPKRDLFRIKNLVRVVCWAKPDVLYANSLFSRITIRLLVARRLGWLGAIPMVLAPRGEFSPGALSIRKYRKWSFLTLGSYLALFKNLFWQASTEFERQDIMQALGSEPDVRVSRNIAIAPDLFELRNHHPAMVNPPKQSGTAHFVFLSRVSPKKNLRTAIDLIGALSGEVSLDIYGGIDDQKYWRECQAAIARVRPGVKVTWHGPVNPDEVTEVFARFDFFVFPTLGENFGHVILESLGAGCPVLLSDTTPWNRLESDGAGWILPLEQRERWSEALQRCVDMNEADHYVMRDQARTAARHLDNRELAIQQNMAVFEGAVRGHTDR